MNLLQKINIKIKNKISTTKFKKNMLILLFILTLLCLHTALGVVSYVAGENTELTIEYMWIFLLFLPIPILSIVLGIIYRKKGYLCKKNIVGGIIIAIILFLYGTMPFTSEYKDGISNDYSYVNKIEEIINFTIPETGQIQYNQLTGININNTFELISKSYVYFSSDEEINQFEESLISSAIWKNKNTSYMQMQEPREYIEAIEGNIYYMLFNKTENSYNTVPSKEGTYEIYFLMYDVDNNKLYLLNYNYTFIPE